MVETEALARWRKPPATATPSTCQQGAPPLDSTQFHLERVAVPPNEAYSPASRDANAVLPLTIPDQSLKTVARGYAEVVDAGRMVDAIQFAASPLENRLRERSRVYAIEDVLGTLVGE